MGDTATTGGEEPGVNVFPKLTGVAVTADIGATTAVRPLCAATARGGEVGLELECTPPVADIPTGRELDKIGRCEAPLPCPVVTSKPRALLLDSSPKLSAMAHKLASYSKPVGVE